MMWDTVYNIYIYIQQTKENNLYLFACIFLVFIHFTIKKLKEKAWKGKILKLTSRFSQFGKIDKSVETKSKPSPPKWDFLPGISLLINNKYPLKTNSYSFVKWTTFNEHFFEKRARYKVILRAVHRGEARGAIRAPPPPPKRKNYEF